MCTLQLVDHGALYIIDRHLRYEIIETTVRDIHLSGSFAVFTDAYMDIRVS